MRGVRRLDQHKGGAVALVDDDIDRVIRRNQIIDSAQYLNHENRGQGLASGESTPTTAQFSSARRTLFHEPVRSRQGQPFETRLDNERLALPHGVQGRDRQSEHRDDRAIPGTERPERRLKPIARYFRGPSATHSRQQDNPLDASGPVSFEPLQILREKGLGGLAMRDYGDLARDYGASTITDQNETLVSAAVASPLAIGERLVDFFDDVANDLLDRGRSEQTEKAAVRQNRREDVEILGSLPDGVRNPMHFFRRAVRAVQHNGQFASASAFGQLRFHQFAPPGSNAGGGGRMRTLHPPRYQINRQP